MAKRFSTIEISNPAFTPKGLKYVTVKSRYLKGRGDCTFFIPAQVKQINGKVPVVILLHGVYGSHWAWTYNINVHHIAAALIEKKKIAPMVLVMPSDGLMGDGTGYFKHGEKDYERWIVDDVVHLVDEVSPRNNDKLNLFISGLSMGGYGAMRIMAKYPSLFSGGSGLSSITCLKDLLPFLAPSERRYYRESFGAEELIGYMRRNKKRLPPFRFDCGKDDALFRSNVALHRQLEEAGIPHVFEELSGDHSNTYWNRNIERTLIYFDQLAKQKSKTTVRQT